MEPVEAVEAALARTVRIGAPAQAFPFVTVDAFGFPHVALLSGVELRVLDPRTITAVVAGPTTRENLTGRRAASVVVVEHVTCHTLKLRVRELREIEGVTGASLEVVDLRSDSLGLPITGIEYVPTPELSELEAWDRAARVHAALRA